MRDDHYFKNESKKNSFSQELLADENAGFAVGTLCDIDSKLFSSLLRTTLKRNLNNETHTPSEYRVLRKKLANEAKVLGFEDTTFSMSGRERALVPPAPNMEEEDLIEEFGSNRFKLNREETYMQGIDNNSNKYYALLTRSPRTYYKSSGLIEYNGNKNIYMGMLKYIKEDKNQWVVRNGKGVLFVRNSRGELTKLIFGQWIDDNIQPHDSFTIKK